MIKFNFSYASQVNTPLKRGLIRVVEVLSGRVKLEQLYIKNQRAPMANESFWAACMRLLQLNIQFDTNALIKTPATGPLIVIANHPYGVLDGLTISYLVEQVRPDFMILASAVLTQVPEINHFILPVDLSNRPEAKDNNLETRNKARNHIKNGGALIIFPAGLISTTPDRWGRELAIDPPWGNFTSQLIKDAHADVLPVFFSGQNSRAFQIASHISRSLRLALIFHEVKARIGTCLPVAVGNVIPYTELKLIRDNRILTAELRKRTYALSGNCSE